MSQHPFYLYYRCAEIQEPMATEKLQRGGMQQPQYVEWLQESRWRISQSIQTACLSSGPILWRNIVSKMPCNGSGTWLPPVKCWTQCTNQEGSGPALLGGWPTVQRTTCQYGRQHG